MDEADFRAVYSKCQTWKDGRELIARLTQTQLEKFIDAHEQVKVFTGLDQRQEWFLTEAKARLPFFPEVAGKPRA